MQPKHREPNTVWLVVLNRADSSHVWRRLTWSERHDAARTLGSESHGLRASRPHDQGAGVDRDHPSRDFATARRDRIGAKHGRSIAAAFVAYRTIHQSHS